MSEAPITYRGTVYPWHCDHKSTYEQRHRWWYNFLAAILIFGGLGFLYEVIASRGSFIGL